MSTPVEVAAAVILRNGGREFLLAQRPPGKVYAGYWEFPGGKVEPGETIRAALVRELQEELGIAVQAATPWLTRRFVYPHATVRIHFWRVTAWEGEIGVTAPVEHSAVAWLKRSEPPRVAPVLPANGPILNALTLPTVMGITHCSEIGEDGELARLETAASRGVGLIQVREKSLPEGPRAWFAQSVVEMARSRGLTVVINDDPALATRLHAGLHLPAERLRRTSERPNAPLVGASCHDGEELCQAAALGLDYALLGPVMPTPTHPDQAGLGWDAFTDLVAETEIPVFALGGLRLEHLDTAQSRGAHGIALMRGW
jgi:8-oxo-dGTP diphosphatase